MNVSRPRMVGALGGLLLAGVIWQVSSRVPTPAKGGGKAVPSASTPGVAAAVPPPTRTVAVVVPPQGQTVEEALPLEVKDESPPSAPVKGREDRRDVTPEAAAAGPVILTDHQAWTVIGADASTVASNRVQFSGGLGISGPGGVWIEADQGAVLLDPSGVSGFALGQGASLRANRDTPIGDLLSALQKLQAGETPEIRIHESKTVAPGR